MATVTILEQGHRNLVLNVLSTAAESVTLVDVTTLDPVANRVRLERITYDAGPGVTVTFSWDATADEPFLTITEGNGQTACYRSIGGINNTAVGATGNVLMAVVGASATAPVHMVMHFVKKRSGVPAIVGEFILTEGGNNLITENSIDLILET